MEVEPRVRGERGYADWCLYLVERGICSCEGCGGHLEDGICQSCGCGHRVSEANAFHARLATWTVLTVTGRCADVERHFERERREHDRQARLRHRAEELGDPQR